MQVRETAKYYVLRFASFDGRPASVYYDKQVFARTAARYGWGAGKANDIVSHCGDKVPLIEVLHDSIKPSRVVY